MRIIFVYNLNRGIKNSTIGTISKTIRASSYPCKLSALTFSTFRVKKDWKKFVESQDQELEFLYKNQFDEQFKGHPFSLPAVFRDNGKQLEQLLSSEDFDSINSLDELIQKVDERIKQL